MLGFRVGVQVPGPLAGPDGAMEKSKLQCNTAWQGTVRRKRLPTGSSASLTKIEPPCHPPLHPCPLPSSCEHLSLSRPPLVIVQQLIGPGFLSSPKRQEAAVRAPIGRPGSRSASFGSSFGFIARHLGIFFPPPLPSTFLTSLILAVEKDRWPCYRACHSPRRKSSTRHPLLRSSLQFPATPRLSEK